MSIFDIFRKQAPQREPLPELKLAHKPGTLYYLRARNLYSGFDDVLCFEDEPSRQHYMDYGTMSTPNPSDWYFDCWEETAEERAQKSLTDQRNTLLQSFETDKRALEHRLRAALQKYNDCKADKERLSAELQQATYDCNEYKYKLEQEKQAPSSAPDAKAILCDIANQTQSILTCMDSSKLDRIASKHKEQLAKLDKLRMPLQGKLVLALIEHEINKL